MNSIHRSTLLILLFSLLITFSGCKYSRGDTFNYTGSEDSLIYILAAKGSGRHIIKKVKRLYIIHELRYDDCTIFYISDSTKVVKNKSILLFNSILPDIEDDFLTKGFMGAFGTKQKITYMVVTQNDLTRYFTPVKKHHEDK